MKVSQQTITDAAIEAAASRILGHNRIEARRALEAALPEIREAIAQEIEAQLEYDGMGEGWDTAINRIVDLVRGNA